jgi:hypothetical protein
VGGSLTTIIRGLIVNSSVSWIPIWCNVADLRFSTSTSLTATRCMNISRCSGMRTSSVQERLPRASELFMAWRL